MPLFIYEAVSMDGSRHKGRLECECRSQAVEQLKGTGLFVVDIKKQSILNTDIGDLLKNRHIFGSGPGTSKKDLALFCRQLSFILDAGADINGAFHILKPQGKRPDTAFGRVIADINDLILRGESLSACMEINSHYFPPLLSGMVRAGESSGSLSVVMARMADCYEKEASIAEEIKSALIYPVAVSVMMLFVTVTALIYVVPAYSALFAAEGVALPIYTRILISVSDFLMRHHFTFVFSAVAAFIPVKAILAADKGIYFTDWCRLNVKPWNAVYLKLLNLRFAQTMALLLDSGLRTVPSLTIIKSVLNNKAVNGEIEILNERLSEGASLSEALSGVRYFEPLLCDMVKIGEESGNLPGTLSKCAEYFQNESDTMIRRLNKLIEPAVTVVLGLIMAFIMLAVMLPTFSLTDIF